MLEISSINVSVPPFLQKRLNRVQNSLKSHANSHDFIAVYAGWTGLGSLMNGPYVYHYPVTTAGCNITNITELANISSPVYDPATWNPKAHYR